MTEYRAWKTNGFAAVLGGLAFLALAGWSIRLFVLEQSVTGVLLTAVSFFIASTLLASGIFVVQPNQAKALTFFGRYMGSVRESGIWFSIPLTIVELDEERKVAMINNLMVAIVSDRAAQPVINTGSLY